MVEGFVERRGRHVRVADVEADGRAHDLLDSAQPEEGHGPGLWRQPLDLLSARGHSSIMVRRHTAIQGTPEGARWLLRFSLTHLRVRSPESSSSPWPAPVGPPDRGEVTGGSGLQPDDGALAVRPGRCFRIVQCCRQRRRRLTGGVAAAIPLNAWRSSCPSPAGGSRLAFRRVAGRARVTIGVGESSQNGVLKYQSPLLRISYPTPTPGRCTSRAYLHGTSEQRKAIDGGLGGFRARGAPGDRARTGPVSGCGPRHGHLATTGPARPRKVRL